MSKPRLLDRGGYSPTGRKRHNETDWVFATHFALTTDAEARPPGPVRRTYTSSRHGQAERLSAARGGRGPQCLMAGPGLARAQSKPPPQGTAGQADPLAGLKADAAKGKVSAMVALGDAYARGTGVAKDYTEAAAWYRKAADAGSAEGMAKLGALYGMGVGVPQDDQQAAAWSRKAAEAGHARIDEHRRLAVLPRQRCRAGLRAGGRVVPQSRGQRRRGCDVLPRRHLRRRPGRTARLRPGGRLVSQSCRRGDPRGHGRVRPTL